jgi:hypothetical protein
MEYVYIATEETKVVDAFREAFGDKLIHTASIRHKEYNRELIYSARKSWRENDKYISNIEYITDMMLLAECDCFIATQTSGTQSALYINGNRYLHKHIIDLGVY